MLFEYTYWPILEESCLLSIYYHFCYVIQPCLSKYQSLLFVIVLSESIAMIGHGSFDIRLSISYIKFDLVAQLLMSFLLKCTVFIQASVVITLTKVKKYFLIG